MDCRICFFVPLKCFYNMNIQANQNLSLIPRETWHCDSQKGVAMSHPTHRTLRVKERCWEEQEVRAMRGEKGKSVQGLDLWELQPLETICEMCPSSPNPTSMPGCLGADCNPLDWVRDQLLFLKRHVQSKFGQMELQKYDYLSYHRESFS